VKPILKSLSSMEQVFRMQDAFRQRYGLRAVDHYTVNPTGKDELAEIEFTVRPITDVGQEFLEDWLVETVIREVHDE